MKLVCIAAVLLAPVVAQAEEQETLRAHDPGLYVLVGALAANTAFTIYNVATIGERKSDLYAFGESVLTVPQTFVFGGLALLAEDEAWIPAAFAVWTTALAAHGIYTLATDEGERTSTSAMGRTVMLSFGDRF